MERLTMSKELKEREEQIAELEKTIKNLEKLANHYMQKSNQLENNLILANDNQEVNAEALDG